MVILGTTLSYGYCRPSTIAMLTIDLGKRKAFGSFLGACWHQHPQAIRALPGRLENCSIDICNPIPSWELTYHPKKGCRIYMTFFLNHEIPTRRSLPVHTAYWCSFFCDSWMRFHASGFLYSLLCTIAVCCLGLCFNQIGSCKLIHPSEAIASTMLCPWNLKSPCVTPILHKSTGSLRKISWFSPLLSWGNDCNDAVTSLRRKSWISLGWSVKGSNPLRIPLDPSTVPKVQSVRVLQSKVRSSTVINESMNHDWGIKGFLKIYSMFVTKMCGNSKTSWRQTSLICPPK